ncbi:prenyltransferase/squalene oxidase repeat-containing protein [Stieleria marina]|uniref:prenyltransferase/squalene oxidase repeat-containing protein n=1 Tax=Stieleria marina TaxID=1930275 RepID=UPI003AF35404
MPPPPPPRSTLAPVRKGAEISPNISGVGSATSPRWRGELQDINRRAEAKENARRALMLAAETGGEVAPETVAEAEEDYEDPIVTRTAPPWLLSTVIHLVLLLILALITSPVGSGIGRVLLVMGLSEQQTDSTLTEFTIEAPVEVGEDLEETEDIPIEIDTPQIFEMAQPIVEDVKAPPEVGVGPSSIDISMPMFNGRTGAMKKALLSIYGGTPETEEAVASGLAWLKRNQQRDGSWSMRGPFGDGGITENRTAATAMALLAFMGDGNTHKGGEYKDEVLRGVKYLIGKQARDGFMAREARGHEKMYAQAQATIALCELYGMTGDSWLRPRAQLAVEFAEKSQSSEGGWRYEPRFDADTSVTGWFVMALKSAQSTDLIVNDSILRKVSGYLDTVSSYGGAAYSYQQRGSPSPAMTAEGLLCRQYLGWFREHPPMQRGIEALLLDSPFDMRDRDVYYWYYATQALHHFGGPHWREWNNVMRVQLPKAQVKQGRERGSWAPQGDQWGRNSGRLYTTCLSIYCLEVYYRHMPLYKENAADKAAAGKDAADPTPDAAKEPPGGGAKRMGIPADAAKGLGSEIQF